MAAALSLARPLHGRHAHRPWHKPRAPGMARFPLSCRSQMLSDPDHEDGGERKREETGPGKEEKKGRRRTLGGRIVAEAEKAGRGLKESLSPRRKGDWKDVLLMSLSFAVYVYISQRLVSAYCAWISMLSTNSRF